MTMKTGKFENFFVWLVFLMFYVVGAFFPSWTRPMARLPTAVWVFLCPLPRTCERSHATSQSSKLRIAFSQRLRYLLTFPGTWWKTLHSDLIDLLVCARHSGDKVGARSSTSQLSVADCFNPIRSYRLLVKSTFPVNELYLKVKKIWKYLQ